MKPYKHLAICVLLLIFGSCQPIFRLMIGVRNPRPHSVEDIRKWAEKLSLENYPLYSLDTAFFTAMSGKYDSFPVIQKAFVQPAQVYCFDQKGKLLSMSTNCYYPGMLKTKWAFGGTFDSFPILNRLDSALLNSLSFRTLNNFLQPVNNHAYKPSQEMVVLFMNESFNRMAKTLSKTIKQHFPDKQILIVNTDNYYYHLLDGEEISFTTNYGGFALE